MGTLPEGAKPVHYLRFGLSPELAGLAVGIGLIFDAASDPLGVFLSNNTKSRQGRRHPNLYAPFFSQFQARSIPIKRTVFDVVLTASDLSAAVFSSRANSSPVLMIFELSRRLRCRSIFA